MDQAYEMPAHAGLWAPLRTTEDICLGAEGHKTTHWSVSEVERAETAGALPSRAEGVQCNTWVHLWNQHLELVCHC